MPEINLPSFLSKCGLCPSLVPLWSHTILYAFFFVFSYWSHTTLLGHDCIHCIGSRWLRTGLSHLPILPSWLTHSSKERGFCKSQKTKIFFEKTNETTFDSWKRTGSSCGYKKAHRKKDGSPEKDPSVNPNKFIESKGRKREHTLTFIRVVWFSKWQWKSWHISLWWDSLEGKEDKIPSWQSFSIPALVWASCATLVEMFHQCWDLSFHQKRQTKLSARDIGYQALLTLIADLPSEEELEMNQIFACY